MNIYWTFMQTTLGTLWEYIYTLQVVSFLVFCVLGRKKGHKCRVPTIWKYQGKPGKLQNIFPVRENSLFWPFLEKSGKIENVREKIVF